jgi:nickel-dependent lactate racemase
MVIQFPYGDTLWEEDVPGLGDAFVLKPPENLEPVSGLTQAVSQALESSLGSHRLRDLVQPNDGIAVIISDATRSSPSRFFLDGIVTELEQAGVSLQNVTIVVATGTHRGSTREELVRMLGEEHLARFKVVSHDCHNRSALVYLGETKRGVPVWINRTVAEATFCIATGTITPHHVMGYSGGRKAILPGVAGELTVRWHHSFPIRPFQPAFGQMGGNPAHEEALQAAKMLGVDFIINAVPDPQSRGFLGIVAGDLVAAHLAGVQMCGRACRAFFPFQADLTICSPGGHPRDINLHQAQKALSVAEMVTRPGGVIILVAECRKGIGSEFAQWLQRARTPQEVIKKFQDDGWLASSGKAMMFARATTKHKVMLVSEAFSRDYLSSLFLHKAESLKEAMTFACEILGSDPKTVVIPRASGLIPVAAGHPDERASRLSDVQEMKVNPPTV